MSHFIEVLVLDIKHENILWTEGMKQNLTSKYKSLS